MLVQVFVKVKLKIKLKFTTQQAMKVQTGVDI
jgi:hypothetical protein